MAAIIPIRVSPAPGRAKYSRGCLSVMVSIILVMILAPCITGFSVLASLWYFISMGTSMIFKLFLVA